MYIPQIFSTAENGCPDGYNSYQLWNIDVNNPNTGARNRLTFNWNTSAGTVVGENFQGDGGQSGATLTGPNSTGFQALKQPGGGTFPNIAFPIFGDSGLIVTEVSQATGSNNQPINFCYDCTKKWRWTFGSISGQAAPFPIGAVPLTIAILSSPTGSITSNSSYTTSVLNFTYGGSGSIEGYGPVWQYGGNNAAHYNVISRENVTPRYYGIQNCATSSVTASIGLSGTATLNVGDVFKSSTSTLSGSCWSVTSSFQSGAFTPNISNVVTASTFASCINCTDPLSIKYNIADCSTSINYVSTFSSAPTLGTIFKSNDLQKCFTIVSQASQSVTTDYTNLSIAQTYVDCANCLATSGSLLISSLVVGGGGAGGGYYGGGGGAGEYQAPSNVLISTGSTYPVIVGSGGVAAAFKGTDGGSSSFNGIISIGGGAGGALYSEIGNTGASGGGGSYYTNAAGGTGTAGNNGGTGIDGTSGDDKSGGGGGASAVGANGSTTSNGGDGTQWIDGTYYAGGGGGYRRQTPLSSNGSGGNGGGGIGWMGQLVGGAQLRASTSGSANTGGGGGGSLPGGGTWDGGSGVVKIRYAASSSLATGGDIIISGSYVYHTFTGSGNFTF